MKKVNLAIEIIEKRIAHADHVLTGIPGERQLAEEIGLSRRTVRHALQVLVEKGTLIRASNGRVRVAAPANGIQRKTICFIMPMGSSGNMSEWQQSAITVSQGQDVTMKSVSYGHFDDPLIQDVLTSFDAAFFMTYKERIPPWLVAKIKESSCKVVVLDQDESEAGLPSVHIFPPIGRKLFDHLYRLGHRRIDCINTQDVDMAITERLDAWREYLEVQGVTGQLLSSVRDTPAESAYELVRDALRSGQPVASALFCTTCPAAIGAMRALQEAGLKVGDDVSICAVNGEGLGRYLPRSLTTLEPTHRSLFLRKVNEWMLSDAEWQGPLLLQPAEAMLFEGESTGPAPTSSILSLGAREQRSSLYNEAVKMESSLVG